jgi:hypothetical protein
MVVARSASIISFCLQYACYIICLFTMYVFAPMDRKLMHGAR